MCVDILWFLGQPGFTWRIAHNFHAFTPRQPGSTRVSRRVPRVGEVWKGWPGCRVNTSRKLLVDGLTRADKPTRVDSQPGLV